MYSFALCKYFPYFQFTFLSMGSKPSVPRGKDTGYIVNHRKFNPAEAHIFLCHNCKKVGKSLDAVGFCNTCQKYLCDKCADKHFTEPKTKRHKLMEIVKKEQSQSRPEYRRQGHRQRRKRRKKAEKSKQEYLNKQLKASKSKQTLQFQQELDFTLEEDNFECWVSGFDVMLDGKVVIADGANCKIKFYDKFYTFLHAKSVYGVLDVAVVTDVDISKKVANLAFLNRDKVDKNSDVYLMKKEGDINIYSNSENKLDYLQYYDKHFYVSGCSNAQILVINFEGEEVKFFQSDNYSISYFAINPKNGNIYASHYYQGIKGFNQKGEEVFSLQNDDVQFYFGIVTDKKGNIYVSTKDANRNRVYILKQEGLVVEVLLSEKSRLNQLEDLYYNRDTDSVLIRRTGGPTLGVFRIVTNKK